MSAADTRLVELRDRVEEQQVELRSAVRELEQATRRAFDLEHRFAAHPWLFTAGAVLLGAWLGGRR